MSIFVYASVAVRLDSTRRPMSGTAVREVVLVRVGGLSSVGGLSIVLLGLVTEYFGI